MVVAHVNDQLYPGGSTDATGLLQRVMAVVVQSEIGRPKALVWCTAAPPRLLPQWDMNHRTLKFRGARISRQVTPMSIVVPARSGVIEICMEAP